MIGTSGSDSADVYGEALRNEPLVTHDAILSEDKTITRLRCEGCNKLLAELVTAPWALQCARCKTLNLSFEEHDFQGRELMRLVRERRSSRNRSSSD